MLKTLLIKEMQEYFVSLRFYFMLAICVILIPLNFYLGADEYRQRKEHIDNLEKLYLEKNKEHVSYDLRAEGFRRPSPMSIFCIGLEYYLPDKAITQREGKVYFSREWGLNNPLSLLSGKIDFAYVVCFILSLLVLSLTFNAISGEKEAGTLKLMLSNQIPKWKIIIAKIIGPFLLLSLSFLAGVLMGTLILAIIFKVLILNSLFINGLLAICFFSLLFLFAVYNLGVLISIVGKNSYLSVVINLLVYIVLALMIPKISPMVAQVIYPVESVQVHNTQKDMIYNQRIEERENSKKQAMAKIKDSYNVPQSLSELDFQPEKKLIYQQKVVPQYESEVSLIDAKMNPQIESEVQKFENAYFNKCNIQKNIGLNISRISLFSSFNNIVADLSSTGTHEMENFNKQAFIFHDYVNKELYNKAELKKYYDKGGYMCYWSEHNNAKPPKDAPTLNQYNYMNITSVLNHNGIDTFLLFFFSILFFSLSILAFVKYDIR